MFRTVITIALFAGLAALTVGCKSDSSIAHKDPIYADLGAGVVDLGSVGLSNQSVETAENMFAFDGPKTYRFTVSDKARVLVSIIAGPGARDVSANLWAGNGWGYVGPFEDWNPDWSLTYEANLGAGDYDIVVAPTGNTAGQITVRVEALEILPKGI